MIMDDNNIGYVDISGRSSTFWETEIDRKIANLQLRLSEVERKLEMVCKEGDEMTHEKTR